MNCYICDKKDWFPLPELNDKRLLQVCKSCGNIAYDVDIKDEEKIKNYYRNEYRGLITEQNLLTTSRKLNYITGFIMEWLSKKEQFNEKGKVKEPMSMIDIGCATGYLVNWFNIRGHKVTGTEWTPAMRSFAEHFYSVLTTEEVDTSKQYDFMSMYHVLEHIMEPDKKLSKYVQCLSDKGRILVATPRWNDEIQDSSGQNIISFENLYHKDHINVFTIQSLKNLFIKCGLIIEKEDQITYGQTYLLRRGTPSGSIIIEPWKDQVEKLKKIKQAIDLYLNRKFEDAIKIWPKFPDAWHEWIFGTSIRKDMARAEELLLKARELMPGNITIESDIAMFYYQQEKYDQCLPIYQYLLQKRPNEKLYIFMGRTLYLMGQSKQALPFLVQAGELNPMVWAEAMRWVTKICSEMPNWEETARKELQNVLINKVELDKTPKGYADAIKKESLVNGQKSKTVENVK